MERKKVILKRNMNPWRSAYGSAALWWVSCISSARRTTMKSEMSITMTRKRGETRSCDGEYNDGTGVAGRQN